jgi:hypothetical protein
MLVSAVLPLVVYALLRSRVGSDVEALAIGGAIPAAWVLVSLAWRRRVDWIALTSVVLLVLAVLLSLVSGGSSLPLKLREAVVTGVLGLACVGSVVAGKPLPLFVVRLRARRDARARRSAEQVLDDPVRQHAVTVLTMLVGITLLAAAAVRVILAVVLPTVVFLGLASIVEWVIIAAGALPTLWYAHRQRVLLRSRGSDAVPGKAGDPAGADRAS